jgi:hypothetical protein
VSHDDLYAFELPKRGSKEVPSVGAALDVERCQRLVQEKKARLEDQSARQRDLLRLPAG